MTATIVTIPQEEIDAYVSRQDLSRWPALYWQAMFLTKRISDAGVEVCVFSVISGAIRVRGCRVAIERNDADRVVRVLIDREVAA
ncbi:hypothetical protein [Aeromonas media]|uniref:hypothetical protein n=1 Tax=Aeromonas media TaxID=651 RepID=UPI001604033E|nr:hypothetical protein [Aeromonas media]